MARLPFIFFVAFTAFFYYYHWIFLSGLLVVVLAIVSQTCSAMWLAKIQKKLMEAKDGRMKATTEALNNPKMLKLYSWEKNFMKRIWRKRIIELV